MNAPQAKTTVADYLAFERASTERHQFFDGEIFAMAGESLAHSTINANIIISLGSQLRGKPCRVLSPNMKIRSDCCTKTGAFCPRSDEPLGLHLCRRIGRLPDPAQFRR